MDVDTESEKAAVTAIGTTKPTPPVPPANTTSQCDETGIHFSINGKNYSVFPEYKEFEAETSLVDYIRDEGNLKGTKTMCREGGCGACIVQAKSHDPATGKQITKAINSCLTPVLSCNGWEITTVEGLGNRKDGYHRIQKTLTKFNGTQCGFCSPGMVMSMYSLMNSKKQVKVQDVHDHFDGNICRCTGFRPILDAFKSLAVDAPKNSRDVNECQDIEDVGLSADGCGCDGGGCCKLEPQRKLSCNANAKFNLTSGQEWVQATTLKSAYQHLKRFTRNGEKYRVVAGNTGTGVFKYDGPYKAFLDVNRIPALKRWTIDPTNVAIGGGVTLTSAIKILMDASEVKDFSYTAEMSQHLGRVASTPVRNNGTIAGNLMMKHDHHDFPSDVFILLESVKAKIHVGSEAGKPAEQYTPAEFIKIDMVGKLITSISLPPRKGDCRLRTYKITKRYQNAHAYVNAGIFIKLDPAKNFLVLAKPRIVYGGIGPEFKHISLLTGKELKDEKVLKEALKILDREVNPKVTQIDTTAVYRKTLAKSLLYKTILGIIGDGVKENLKSGASDLKRKMGRGMQKYDVPKDGMVLYDDLQKIEAGVQASGEAEYIDDIPMRPNELHGAFVISSVGNADLVSMDASEALKLPGVVKFLTYKDIPGKNDFMSFAYFTGGPQPEPVFVKDKISYAGQSLGMILAETRAQALAATKSVKVKYSNVQEPMVDTKKAMESAEKDGKLDKFPSSLSKTPMTGSPKHVVKGEFQMGGQYHFHMELQSCVCIPKEDGMDIYSSTQWLDHIQIVTASVLGIQTNKINVEARRLGGGFGAKISKATLLSAAGAVGANAVNRPVRVVLDMETNMKMIGGRSPYIYQYEVGFDDDGKIGKLKLLTLGAAGFSPNEDDSAFTLSAIQSTYKVVGWEVTSGHVLTNAAPNTWIRGPGTVQGVVCIEYIMEHIAQALKKDPLKVRLANFLKEGDELFPVSYGNLKEINLCARIIEEMKVTADFEARKEKVKKFNQENRWVKRGMSVMPMRFGIEFLGAKFPLTVVIYHSDATVAVSYGGIEMGQGINTKVAQTVAQTFGITMDKIQIKPANTFAGANAFFAGASFTSELCCDAAQKACKILLERMKPVRDKLDKDKSWEGLITAAFNANLDLSASYMNGPNDNIGIYYVWIATVAEVEVDVLTGEFKVVRVDITEDCGKSLNPAIDIGQVEGGYLMGQGLFTSEKLIYDKKTGELLTCNTWEYKPPEAADVPEDFRVTLLSNAPNAFGVLRSKSAGEPPLVSAFAVFLALKNAIDSARKDAGNNDWYQIDTPVTAEDIIRLSLTSSSQFRLY